MTISIGDKLPEAHLLRMGPNGPESVTLSSKLSKRKVVIFAVIGAYTGVCTVGHMPSYIRQKDAILAKGVDEIICISVNDPFVLQAWGEATGASAAGITILGDSDAAFTESVGMRLDVPAIGFIARSKRYVMVVEDGVVTAFREEVELDSCPLTSGEGILELL